MDMFKAHSKSVTNQAIFYIFEVFALIVAVAFAAYGVYLWVYSTQVFGVGWYAFFSGVMQIVSGLIYCGVLYGIGKVIDLAPVKSCCEKSEEEISTEAEEKADEE